MTLDDKLWANEAKIAVLVTVMFETWSEGKAPSYSPMTTSLKEGTLDRLGISWAEYEGFSSSLVCPP